MARSTIAVSASVIALRGFAVVGEVLASGQSPLMGLDGEGALGFGEVAGCAFRDVLVSTNAASAAAASREHG